MKKYTGMTNGQIGQIFNGLTFSAVAKVYHRMSKAVEENRTLRKKVTPSPSFDGLKLTLQGQTVSSTNFMELQRWKRLKSWLQNTPQSTLQNNLRNTQENI